MSVKFEELKHERVFSHMDDETGAISILAIDRLTKSNAYRCIPTTLVEIDFEFAEFVLHNRGIEMHRLAKLAVGEFRDPITFLKWPNGTDLLADGNHRYVAAAIRRAKDIKSKIVPASVWRKFLITDIPKEYDKEAFQRHLNGFSGIFA
jgi:hypothetical protein